MSSSRWSWLRIFQQKAKFHYREKCGFITFKKKIKIVEESIDPEKMFQSEEMTV